MKTDLQNIRFTSSDQSTCTNECASFNRPSLLKKIGGQILLYRNYCITFMEQYACSNGSSTRYDSRCLVDAFIQLDALRLNSTAKFVLFSNELHKTPCIDQKLLVYFVCIIFCIIYLMNNRKV